MSSEDDDVPIDSNPVVVLLFLFVGLALGVIIEQFMTRTKSLSTLPFTVVLFCLGLVMATISKSHFGDEFNASLHDWIHIDADLMLFVFLPPLIFGEAMSLQWHHIRTALPQCLWLAGPGVLLGTGILGMFTKLVLPYHWSWLLCLLYASILSATDTVAVLSIMSGAGASPKLSIIIVGESLFNDGTSLVVLTLLLDFIKYGNVSSGKVVAFLFSMTLGSFALGGFIGYLTVIWLRMVNRPLKEVDVASQVTITLTVAYLTFYLAQEIFNISGVLAIVGAALMLSWQAPPIILNKETMHTVWSFIEWIGNTVIFLLAGLIIGHKVLDGVNGFDWVYVIVLYIMCSLTRCLVMMILYPAITSSGHKASMKEVVFMAFAGLRGALGMALGLLVIDYSEYVGIAAEDANRLFFYVGGVVTLSLLINGSLCNHVLGALDLGSKDSIGQMLIMDQIKRKMRKKINKMVNRMETELEISPADMMEIRMSCSILRPSKLDVDALVGSMNDEELRLTGSLGHTSMSLTKRLAEAHAKAILSGHMESDISNPASAGGSGRSRAPEGDEDDGDDKDDLPGVHGGRHIDSDSDSDVSVTHKSFRKNVVDMEDSWMDASQLTSAAAAGTAPGMSDLGGIRSRAQTSNPADDRAQFRSRARSKTPPGASGGAGYQRAISEGDEHLQRTWSVGDWIGMAASRGDRHSRYSQVSVGTTVSFANMNEERRARYSNMSSLLDPTKRKNNQINMEMLAHVRTVFLEIVRVKYWNLIEGGKLPRHCRSAQFLLYSVDVGLDIAQHNPSSLLEMQELPDSDGLGDWKVIEEDINAIPWSHRVLAVLEEYMPATCGGDVSGNILENREKQMEDRAVYMLTAFIEAHEHAQKKIHSFVGIDPHSHEDDDDGLGIGLATAFNQSLIGATGGDHDNSEQGRDFGGEAGTKAGLASRGRVNTVGSENSEAASMQTPEEIRVKEESARLVERARERLGLIEKDSINEIRAKQAAMTVLAREAELVKTMTEEGLLSASQAENLLEEITDDRHTLEMNQDNIFRRRRHYSNASTAAYNPLEFIKGFTDPREAGQDDLSPGASSSVNVPLMDDRADRVTDRKTNDLM